MLTWRRGSGYAFGACSNHDPVKDLGKVLLCTYPCSSPALVFRGPKPMVRVSRGLRQVSGDSFIPIHMSRFLWQDPAVYPLPHLNVLIGWESWKSFSQWGRELGKIQSRGCCGEIPAHPSMSRTSVWCLLTQQLSTGIGTNNIFLSFKFNFYCSLINFQQDLKLK